MKAALAAGGIARQALLLPEVVELDEVAAERLADAAEVLAEAGLVLEAFGRGAVVVREVPALLGQADVRGLVRDLADELADQGTVEGLRDRLDALLATDRRSGVEGKSVSVRVDLGGRRTIKK